MPVLKRPILTSFMERKICIALTRQAQSTVSCTVPADIDSHCRAAEEFKHLRHHIGDVRAGRFVIMVLAKEREKRDVAADILNSHGAEFVGFYGRWAWQSLEAGPAILRNPTRDARQAADEGNNRNGGS